MTNNSPSLNNADEISRPAVGDRAPDFVLGATRGGDWRLSDQVGKVTALLFYPKNETLVCTKQMCSVRDNWSDYLRTKAVVVAVSPGTIEQHMDFSRRHLLPLTILADGDRAITKIFSRHWFLPVQFTRAVVVIDAHGIIACQKVYCRVFRPTDKNVIASIYAARADAIVEASVDLLKKSNERNRSILDD